MLGHIKICDVEMMGITSAFATALAFIGLEIGYERAFITRHGNGKRQASAYIVVSSCKCRKGTSWPAVISIEGSLSELEQVRVNKN